MVKEKYKIIAGVDDAGRGPVIGPLIIAGVAVEELKYEKLRKIGVKDSKKLSAHQRRRLTVEILNIAYKWDYKIITPAEIDRAVFYKRKTNVGVLNRLEAEAMAEIIDKLKPNIVYVDSSDVNEKRFKEYIMEKLSLKNVEIISEHKADEKYAVVSAASILAKVKRDAIIAQLRKKYGDFGSGYPSDPKTRFFIKKCIREGVYPKIIRMSWKTIGKLKRGYDEEV